MAKIDVNVPDIGDFKDVPVIEVLVKPGDVVKVDQSLVTLESDKATMDVPSPVAGAVVDVVAKVGDKVSMGVLIARIDAAEADAAAVSSASAAPAETRALAAGSSRAASAAARARGADGRPRSSGRGGGRTRESRFLRRLRRPCGAPTRARARP